ncbi:unnamed protein product [marine sediment metagenome]|uniref:J domain-containing protein n=1 Tax=marine sediment metagenome TaxID=412755 RepID=X1R6P8_9ZZZZ
MPQNTDDLLKMFGYGSIDDMMDTLISDFGSQAHTVIDRVCKLPQTRTTHYKILGLDPGVSDEVVDLVYKFLARKYHPDMQGGDDERMKVLNVAYEKIMKERGKK